MAPSAAYVSATREGSLTAMKSSCTRAVDADRQTGVHRHSSMLLVILLVCVLYRINYVSIGTSGVELLSIDTVIDEYIFLSPS